MRFTLALLCFSVASACSSGATVVPPQDDGGADASVMNDASPDSPPPAAPCPASMPTQGTPCGARAECEYGGDAHTQCTTLVSCGAPSNGTAKWVVTPPSPDCGMNSGACPIAFDMPPTGSTCPAAGGVTCDYAEGRCDCATCARDGGAAQEWACRAWSELPAGCPSPRPRLGTACATAGQTCNYGVCDLVSFGPAMVCMGGAWVPIVGGGACRLQSCAM